MMIPGLSGYYTKHMVRSLSYVYGLDNTPCSEAYYNTSGHNDKATEQLKELKTTPGKLIRYLRLDDEHVPVDERTLPDGDMALELEICQTASIWNGTNDGQGTGPGRVMLPVFGLVQLASCNVGQFDVLTEVHEPRGGVVGLDTDIGISHAATYAYKQLGNMMLLMPDSSVSLPLVFRGAFPALMKALLKSRIIAKSPLGNASDVRALHGMPRPTSRPRGTGESTSPSFSSSHTGCGRRGVWVRSFGKSPMPLPIRSLPIGKCRSLGPPPSPSACVGVLLWRRFPGRWWVRINGTERAVLSYCSFAYLFCVAICDLACM